MRKFSINEWKILKKSKGTDFAIISIITLVFLAVIAMNVNLLFNMTSSKTEEIGQMQLENIRSDFENKIIASENITNQVAVETENMLASGNSQEQFKTFFYQKAKEQNSISKGVCFNVYIANQEFTIIPNFDIPENYHATERLWYKGAVETPDRIYITEPYVDASGHGMCFTMSKLLHDKETVIALDFTFEDMQESISQMTVGSNRTALIVNKNGMIIGYTDMSLVGEKIAQKLPEYEPILSKIVNETEHDSFLMEINGTQHTIFTSETNNGWYMILSVDNRDLYSDSYKQIIMTIIVGLLMIFVIVIFYLNGVKNRLQSEEALHVKEEFLSHLSKELREPLNKILNLSHVEQMETLEKPAEIAAQVRESALQLSDMLDNLFSFSTFVTKQNNLDDDTESHALNLSKVSRNARNGIVTVLFAAMFLSMALCGNTTMNWGDTKMAREVDSYESQLSNWIANQQSILSVFVNLIAQRPELMADYDSAVTFLNDIAKNYPEISVCYLANPYNENSVIMNNGWNPGPNFKPETRAWYIDTEKSENGFNISAPYRDAQTGLYCVTFSQIVYGRNGEFLGIFGIDFFLDSLINILDESYAKSSYAFLVDKDGIIINHPNPLYQLSNNRMTDISGTEYKNAYNKTGKVFTIKDFNGTFMACLAKVNEASKLTVIVANDWWEIYSSAFTLGTIFIFLLVICIASVIALINHLLEWQQTANAKLQIAVDDAVAAGQAKSQFFAQMSHEIRTPLNAVLGMNELILRESTDKDISEYAENIHSAGNTLLTLINNILDFSKIDNGNMRIVPVRYDTAFMIEDLVNVVSERSRKKGLKFIVDVDSNLPKMLFGDDVRIKQVITNLLTNAVKYTPQGEVKFSIKILSMDADEIKLQVQVTDSGIGIREEDIDKLFQSFQRLDEEKNRNIEGTGLGISIVQKLLTMMNSTLNVRSVYGEGSTFSFDIIQKIIDKNPIGDYKSQVSEKSRYDKNQKYLQAKDAKILVVDDNKMNLKVIRGMLKFNGIVPDMAESGKETLKLAAEKNYHIIFLDHMMPEMDGIETLKELKKLESVKGTTVIALTANAVSGAQEFYISEGFDDYLSKPIDPLKLESALEKYLPKETVNQENVEKMEVAKNVEPETKVEEPKLQNNEEEDEDSLTENEKLLLEKICPEINVHAAMSYCMNSKDFFIEMLQDFYADDKTELLNNLYDEADITNYKIQVHALKSTSVIIGALEFSEKAKSQEMAAKDEDIETLMANHADLTAHYKKIREAIGQWLEVSGNAKNTDS